MPESTNALPMDQRNAPVGSDGRRGVFSTLNLAFLAGLGLVLTPLWYRYFAWSWQRGHYQFFPLLIAFVAFLIWGRLGEARPFATKPKTGVVWVGLGAVLWIAFVGLVLYPALNGAVAAFNGIVASGLLVAVYVYATHGWGGIRFMAPVLLVLVFAVPLPFGFDSILIFQMQLLASKLATWMLDGAGVMHVHEGVMLTTERGQYMTEEACSGVRSLFSSLAVVGVYSVASRHWWPRIVLNLLQTIGWVLVGNAVRIALTLVLSDRVSTWFAAGTGHELLSLGVFGFILLMVSSTDLILGGIYQRIFDGDWGAERELSPPPGKRKRSKSEASHSGSSRALDWGLVNSKPLVGMTIALLALLSILSLRVAWVHSPWGSSASNSLDRLSRMQGDDLPDNLAGWKKEGFEHVRRKGSSLFATDSFTWQYRNQNLVSIVAVDTPWDLWHSLEPCYRALGWKVNMTWGLRGPGKSEPPGMTHSELTLNKPDGRRGIVLFNGVDAKARDAMPSWRHREMTADGILRELFIQSLESLGLGMDKKSAVWGNELPISTIQIFSEKPGNYTEAESKAVEELFFTARSLLLKSQRWAGTP